MRVKKLIITAGTALLVAVFAATASADCDNKLIVNAQQIQREKIETAIKTQGKHKNSYYFDGLSYRLVNIDDDADWEIAAKIDGAVHLGNFFILDKDVSGNYKLTAEQDWKVEEWDFTNPIEIDGKKMFKLVTRTGGTGVDIFNAHLVYLEEGNIVEAWQGTLFEHSVMLGGTHYKKIGSYRFDAESEQLYVWETACQLEQDGMTPKGDFTTTTAVYLFDGKKFVSENSFVEKLNCAL